MEKKDVFISYKSEQYDDAIKIKNVIEARGFSCWMAPESLGGGSNYAAEIPPAITGCSAFVLVLSEEAQKSKYILKELSIAINRDKLILPFMIKECELADAFFFYLIDVQMYSAYKNYSVEMERMIKELSDKIRPSGNTEQVTKTATEKATVVKKDDVKHTISYKNGDTYDGDTNAKGRPHGHGTYVWVSGTTYEGDWVDSERTGKGRLVWASGTVYEGDFLSGKMHGSGTVIYPDGSTHVGQYENDKKNGIGTFKSSGGTYEGSYVDDHREGYGKYTWTSGTVYTGEWKNNQMHGQGTINWTDGKYYIGEFQEGQITGYGKMVYADGSVSEGKFDHGSFKG